MSGAENLQCVPGKEFLVRWRTKNFSMFGIKESQSVESPTFEVPLLGNTQWCLKLLFKRPEESNIMCFLCRNAEGGPEYVKVYYSISGGYSYAAGLQNFARNSSCFDPGLINQGKFIEDVFRGQGCTGMWSEDVLLIECRLWPDNKSVVLTPISPYPVGLELVTIVPKETLSLFCKIPNFSNLPEGQAIEFSANSARSNGVPKLTCRLWMQQQTLRVLVRESNNFPFCFRLKSNVHLLDAFRDRHSLYHGSTVINYGREPLYETMKFSLAMSKKHLMEKADLYLPGDELLLHWEFTYSMNGNFTFIERTLHDEPSDLQVKRTLKWGAYLERKYNENYFFFRFLEFLVVVLSVLQHFLFDNTP